MILLQTLTDADKFLITASGFGFVALVLATTVCFVQPTCYMHKKIWGKQERERVKRIRVAKEMGIPIPLAVLAHSMQTSQRLLSDKGADNGKAAETKFAHQKGWIRSSTNSSMSSGSRGDTSITSESVAETNISEQTLIQGHVTITIRFMPQPQSVPENGRIIGSLNVIVKDAQNLSARPYGGSCDPYVIIQCLQDVRRNRKKKKSLLSACEVKTQIRRKTQCPLFNEGFFLPMTLTDIRQGGLWVKVFDAERYSNHSNLGEAIVSLGQYNLEQEQQQQQEHIVTVDLCAPSATMGNIQLGLSYLPTSERLTIRVLNCRSFNVRDSYSNEATELACRMLLYYGGKPIKRKRTACRAPDSKNVNFDERLTFDVPQTKIDSVTLVIVLCATSLTSSSTETIVAPPPNSRKCRWECLGKVTLGHSVKGSCLQHWESMKASPRLEVVRWQALV